VTPGDENDEQNEEHRASGILQDDLHDDVARIMAAVHDFFHQLIDIADDDGADGVVLCRVKIRKHSFIYLSASISTSCSRSVEGLLLHVFHAAELLDHFVESRRWPCHHVGLPGEINSVQMMAGHHQAFGEFFSGLGNSIKAARQRLDILGSRPVMKVFNQLIADLLGNLLFPCDARE